MAIALFDTNILIDYLKGYQPAIEEVEYWDDACVSAITWMEVMAGAKPDERTAILDFLATYRKDFKLAERLHGHVRTPYDLIDTVPVGFANIVPLPPLPLATPPPSPRQDLPDQGET